MELIWLWQKIANNVKSSQACMPKRGIFWASGLCTHEKCEHMPSTKSAHVYQSHAAEILSTQRTLQRYCLKYIYIYSTQAFNACNIICDGKSQSTCPGGPSIGHNNGRYSKSILSNSLAWICKWTTPKRATGGDGFADKFRSICDWNLFRLIVHVFAWNMREAARKR